MSVQARGWTVGEDMARASSRVTLSHDVKDQYGLPVASVHFDDPPNHQTIGTARFAPCDVITCEKG